MARLDDLIDCEQFLKTADCFLYTVKVFEGMSPALMGITAPAHVISYAFATELYLKVLAQLERSAPPLEGHDLKKLLNDLSSATQKRLEKAWKKANASTIKAKHPYPEWAKLAPGFRPALEASARAFIDWRYGEKTDVRHWFLGGVADEAREIILELRPDLRITTGPRAELNPKPSLTERKAYDFRLPAGWAVLNYKPTPFKSKGGRGPNC